MNLNGLEIVNTETMKSYESIERSFDVKQQDFKVFFVEFDR